MWADVIVHRDTVRVYNNHMQSTQISEDDKQFLGAMAAVPDSARDDRAKGIVRKLVRNFRVRATPRPIRWPASFTTARRG